MPVLLAGWHVVLSFFASRQWMPVAILVIGYAVRLTSSDSPFPVNIPARWRPLVVLALGQLYAILTAVLGGLPWSVALLHGFETAVWTMGLFDVVVNAIWNGTEPSWLQLLLGIVKTQIPQPPVERPKG